MSLYSCFLFQRINRFVMSPNGRYVVCVMDDGTVNVCSIESLSGSAKRVRAISSIFSLAYVNFHGEAPVLLRLSS